IAHVVAQCTPEECTCPPRRGIRVPLSACKSGARRAQPPPPGETFVSCAAVPLRASATSALRETSHRGAPPESLTDVPPESICGEEGLPPLNTATHVMPLNQVVGWMAPAQSANKLVKDWNTGRQGTRPLGTGGDCASPPSATRRRAARW
ncbi:MAG: hypothetical protein IPK17_21600, partial [Chloroflexi bacterium]|uniref:hypothetical protein n=1 Tax=Candidatus Flexifilum breve TaxID=3140694 RepID=UPI003134951B|nr:hypothetical protein [Chloroflexota bacterium]